MTDDIEDEDPENVVRLGAATKLPLPANRILKGAYNKMDVVAVIGWDKEGHFYFASSESNGAEILMMLELAKRRLMDVIDN